ncbi:hypothetical protein TNCV_1136041 [Trichonephila clavipes]|nr:hypothetical protein TNCV_1136041 [Trichonephila clavipes]
MSPELPLDHLLRSHALLFKPKLPKPRTSECQIEDNSKPRIDDNIINCFKIVLENRQDLKECELYIEIPKQPELSGGCILFCSEVESRARRVPLQGGDSGPGPSRAMPQDVSASDGTLVGQIDLANNMTHRHSCGLHVND